MDAVTQTGIELETATAAWKAADTQMRANTRARGSYRHDPIELKAVDQLHKAMNRAAIAHHKARFDAGQIAA